MHSPSRWQAPPATTFGWSTDWQIEPAPSENSADRSQLVLANALRSAAAELLL